MAVPDWHSGNTASLTADRKKVVAEEPQTRQEISELRGLLEKYLQSATSELKPSAGLPTNKDQTARDR
jgi:hypothetical protein